MSERVQKRKVHIAVNLGSADRTGLREGSDTFDFQRFNFLVAFFVAVVEKTLGYLQIHTISNETLQS
jgi:hypothetical protein